MTNYKMSEAARSFVEAAYAAMPHDLHHLESENSFLRTVHKTQDGTEITINGCLVYAPKEAEFGSFPFATVEEARGPVVARYEHTSQGLGYLPLRTELDHLHQDGTSKTVREIVDDVHASLMPGEAGRKLREYHKIEYALCKDLDIEPLNQRKFRAMRLTKRGQDSSHIDTENEHPEVTLLRELHDADELEAAFEKQQLETRIAEEAMGLRDVEANIQRITTLLRTLGPHSMIYTEWENDL